ncbi:MAG: glucosamine-6-phosphate deaminase [Lachnospiraceae bacterium]|nr:glucosamine-6-phosphate deaminase [Lachnospiraceae bacterium]
MREWKKDFLTVRCFETREKMGDAAAADIEAAIRAVLSRKENCNMIFAAAPSQNEVLAGLRKAKVDWSRIHAFHMDEYIGLPDGAPQSFATFLKKALFDGFSFGSVEYINGNASLEEEANRYETLLWENPCDIVVMGIGENGHLAFNDPGVALFEDSRMVKVVELDDACRMQQVHDGCFEKLDLVPRQALTLTIPALISAEYAFCIVPAPAKAEAVKRTLEGAVCEACPASILRRHPQAVLYLDGDSASKLSE